MVKYESDREVVHERELPFPRSLVWKAFTDPAHVNQWWGPDGFNNVEVRMDLRVGGEWTFVMVGPDGTRFPNHSIFTEITPESCIKYDHGDGEKMWFQTTITLEDTPTGTLVKQRLLFPTKEFRDEVVEKSGAIEGGRQHLAKLEAYVGAHLA